MDFGANFVESRKNYSSWKAYGMNVGKKKKKKKIRDNNSPRTFIKKFSKKIIKKIISKKIISDHFNAILYWIHFEYFFTQNNITENDRQFHVTGNAKGTQNLTL